MDFELEANKFCELCNTYNVEILMIDGAAVNFYGYKRHSADIDFWLKPTEENFDKILKVLKDLGYEITRLPESVTNKEQNISLKISPNQEIELITNFNPNRSFDECYLDAESMIISENKLKKIRVISLSDLISSKSISRRTKDMLDIIELKRIHNI